MKVRISFTVPDLDLNVPDDTDMDKYLVDNAWELVKALCAAPEEIIPESWEEVEEE